MKCNGSGCSNTVVGRRQYCGDNCLLVQRRLRQNDFDKKRAQKRAIQWKNDPDLRLRNKQARIKYKINNPDRARDKYRLIRKNVIAKYGNACECCNEMTLQFLSIDHIIGGGHAERKAIGYRSIYRKLNKSAARLPEYRILCYNCNVSYGLYGYCPHKVTSETEEQLDSITRALRVKYGQIKDFTKG